MRALLAALLLAAVAVVVHQTAPTEDEQVAPFVVSADPGAWGQARTFGVRVEDTAVAAELTDADEWTGTTGGVWVVVTVTAETAVRPGALTGSLFLGDRQYDASERPGSSSLNGSSLPPGLPEIGDLVFEVPTTALRDHGADALLRVANRPDPRLDSVVEVPLDLGDGEAAPTHALTAIGRTTR